MIIQQTNVKHILTQYRSGYSRVADPWQESLDLTLVAMENIPAVLNAGYGLPIFLLEALETGEMPIQIRSIVTVTA